MVKPLLATRHGIRALYPTHGGTLTTAVDLGLHEYPQQFPTAIIDRYFQLGVIECATGWAAQIVDQFCKFVVGGFV